MNSLKAYPKKFQFMVLGRSISDSYVLHIDDMEITSTDVVALLDVSVDSKLTFKNHIDELCRKAWSKRHALRRIRLFLSKEKLRLLANAFINYQFLYATLIWMFAGKSSINKICKIHFRRKLQVVRNVHGKSYEELFTVCNDISVHQKHLRILAIEVYKSLMKTNPDFMWNFYAIKLIPYDLRTGEKLYLPTVNTTS